MPQTVQRSNIWRFGVFEADLRSGELRRNGHRIRLQQQPFQLLAILLERQGDVVTQEELAERLWPDVTVDVPRGIGAAVYSVRRALEDNAQSPRYIETIPQRGYRFIATAVPVDDVSEPQSEPPSAFSKHRFLISALVLAGIAFGVLGPEGCPEPPPPPPSARFSYPVENLTVDARTQPVVAISPDGRRIVFGADHALWLQELDQLWSPRKLPGTDYEGVVRPAWSPDSRRLAYSVGRDVICLDLPDGTPKVLASAPGSGILLVLWDSDGQSLVVREAENINGSIPRRNWRIAVEGGELVDAPELATAPPYLSWFGKNGRAVGEGGNPFLHKIVVWDGPHHSLIELGEGRMPQFARSGHVVYQRHRGGDGVWATPFSADQGRPTGQSYLVAKGGKAPTVSNDGTLVYADIPEEYDQLLLLDRHGNAIRHVGAHQRYIAYPSFSPDAKRVAVWGFEYATATDWMVDIWIHEVDRPAKTRLTTHPQGDLYPQWTPDGRSLSFSSDRTHPRDLYLRSVDSSRPAKLLLSDERGKWISDWSADGRRALFWSELNLWLLDTESKQPRSILATPAREQAPVFSPDERYIAFVSDPSGSQEVWVCPIENCGDNIRQVSTAGGYQIRWAKQEQAIYYVEGRTRMMRVKVATDPELSFGEPEFLFESPYLWSPDSVRVSFYDVTDDGEQFVVVDPGRARTTKESPGVIHVWQNWAAAFSGKQE